MKPETIISNSPEKKPTENKFFTRPEKKLIPLANYMNHVASEVNKAYQENRAEKNEDIINREGRINMEAFKVVSGGPHSKEQIKHDKKNIVNRKLEWSGAYNYQNSKDQEKALEIYEKKRQQSKPELMEMATVASFHKAFGNDFIVVRSSEHDDYNHGVDNLIIDKTTGNVVCAFDEVHDKQDGERFNKKNKQIIDAAYKGGKTVDYGLSIDKDGHIQKTKIENIPMFYLAMDSEELDGFLNDLDLSQDKLNAGEIRFLGNMLESINKQKTMLLEQPGLPPKIMANLQNFNNSLEKMRSILEANKTVQKV